jgi:hypothetical protein
MKRSAAEASDKKNAIADENSSLESLLCSLRDMYPDAIQMYAAEKKKPELIELDNFWRNSFPNAVRERKPKHMKLDELSKVMAWKLRRGKMRPLQKKVDGNPKKMVEEVSTQAFKHADAGRWEKAFEELTKLTAIGPATASAILAPLYPNICPFMADEVMEDLEVPRKYDMRCYIQMREELIQKHAMIACDATWVTVEDVGRMIWMRTKCPNASDKLEITWETMMAKVADRQPDVVSGNVKKRRT